METFPLARMFSVTALHSAYRYSFPPDFDFKGERHDFWEIVCVLSGSVTVTEEERVYPLHEGDMIFHAPMEFHRISSAEGTFPQVLVTSFSIEGNLPTKLREGVLHLESQEQDDYQQVFDRLFDAVSAGGAQGFSGQRTADALALFLLRLDSAMQDGETVVDTPAARLYRDSVRCMKAHLQENLSVPQLARLQTVSESTLKHIFAEFAGMGVKKYYTALRMKEAQRLLFMGNSVEEVSDALSFSSPSYFCWAVKRETGKPPSFFHQGKHR